MNTSTAITREIDIAKDWIVERVSLAESLEWESGVEFRVEGQNLNYPIGHIDRRFRWVVSAAHLVRSERYDFSGALWTDRARRAWRDYRAGPALPCNCDLSGPVQCDAHGPRE